jgi:hypothetical protein
VRGAACSRRCWRAAVVYLSGEGRWNENTEQEQRRAVRFAEHSFFYIDTARLGAQVTGVQRLQV